MYRFPIDQGSEFPDARFSGLCERSKFPVFAFPNCRSSNRVSLIRPWPRLKLGGGGEVEANLSGGCAFRRAIVRPGHPARLHIERFPASKYGAKFLHDLSYHRYRHPVNTDIRQAVLPLEPLAPPEQAGIEWEKENNV